MISLSEIEQHIAKKDQAEFEKGENYIDERLIESWEPNGTLNIDLGRQISSRVANRLADKYRNDGGWDVTVNRDPKEGRFYLCFTKPQSQSMYEAMGR